MDELDENAAITTFHDFYGAILGDDREGIQVAYDRLAEMGFDEEQITTGLRALRDKREAMAREEGEGFWAKAKAAVTSDALIPPEVKAATDAANVVPELPERAAGIAADAVRPLLTLGEGALITGPQKTLRSMRDIAQSLHGEDSIAPGESYSGIAKLIDSARRYVEDADSKPNPEGERTPEIVPQTMIDRIAGGVGEGITGDLPLLLAATAAAGPAGFGLMTAAQERAAGGSRGKVLEAGIQGATMGKAMQAAGSLKPLARGTTIGSGAAAQAALAGASPEEIAESGITMGLLSVAPPGGPGELTGRDAARQMATEGKRLAVDLGTDAMDLGVGAMDAAGKVKARGAEVAQAGAEKVRAGGRIAMEAAGVTRASLRKAARAVIDRTQRLAKRNGRVEPADADVVEATTAVRSEQPVDIGLMEGTVREMPTSGMRRDPVRFQYKGDVNKEGVTKEYDDSDGFNVKLAGVIDVWRDPGDGEVYVVNGHHRHYMAERDNVPTMLVKFMDSPNAAGARAEGALSNIADKKGTSIDAAKILRDGGITPEGMRKYGVAVESALAKEAIGLSKLDNGLFTMVAMGDLSPRRGAAIGRELPDFADQRTVVKMVSEREASGKDVSDRTVDEIIRLTHGAARAAEGEGEQGGWDELLGSKSGSSSTILEKADLTGRILETLNKDKRLFGFVAGGQRASRLAEAGAGGIDVDRASEVSERAQRAAAIFKVISVQVGPVSDALNQGALRVRAGEAAAKVAREVYEAIRADIEAALPGGATEAMGAAPEGVGQDAMFRRPGEQRPVEDDAEQQGTSFVPPPAEAAQTPPEEFILEQERQAFWSDDGQIRDSIVALRHGLESGAADRLGVRDLYEETMRLWEAEQTKRADRVGKFGGVDLADEPPGPFTVHDDAPPTERELSETLTRAPGMPEGIEYPAGMPDGMPEPTGDEGPDELPLIRTGWKSIFGVMKPQNKAQVKELVKRSQILRHVMEKLGLVHRRGRIHRRGVLGIMKLRPGVIRTAVEKDMMTNFHEIGHAIDQRAFSNTPDKPGVFVKEATFDAFADELGPLATEGALGPEGFAEFVAHYVLNEVAAMQAAPRFYKHFEKTLDERAPEIKEVLLWSREQLKQYSSQDVFDRVGSNIDNGEAAVKRGGRFDDFYENWVYDRVAIQKYRDFIADPNVRDGFFRRVARNAIDGPKSQFDDLAALDDPNLLTRLLPAWLPHAESWIRKGSVGQLDWHDSRKSLGPSFEEIIEPVKHHGRFQSYMLSLRTLEEYTKARARKAKDPRYKMPPTAISAKDAFELVKKYEAEQPGARQIANNMHRFQMNLLRYFSDSGMLSAENYRRMELAVLYYVPFYRLLEDDVEAGFKRTASAGTNAAVVDLHSPIYRYHGSDYDFISPYESILGNIHTLVYLAKRNEVGQALVRLARKAKGRGGEFVEEISGDMAPAVQLTPQEIENIVLKFTKKEVSIEVSEPVRKFTETIESTTTGPDGATTNTKAQKHVEDRVLEALRARGFAVGEATQMVERIKSAPSGQVRRERVTQLLESVRLIEIKEEMEFIMPDSLVPIFRPTLIRKGEPIVTVRFDGKPVYLRVSPKIYEAVKGLDRDTAKMFTSWMAPANRLMRAGVVLSPEFGPVNFVRDQMTTFMQSKYGFIPFVHPVLALANYIDHSMKRAKSPDGRAGNEWVQQFYLSGGPMADLSSFDRKYLRTGVDQVLRDVGAMLTTRTDASRLSKFRVLVENGLVKAGAPPHGVWLITHPIETFRLINELSDNVTRLATYKLGYRGEEKKGKAEEKKGALALSHRELQARAGFESREGGFDFARAGAKARVANSIFGFFNIFPQGIDRTVRAFRDDPIGWTARGLIGVTLPSVITWLASHDDPRYSEQPDYIRDLYLVIPTGTVSREEWLGMTTEQQRAYNDVHPIVLIPKPHEIGILFGSSVERALSQMYDGDPEAMTRWSKSMLKVLVPSLVPTLFSPSLENALNVSFWRGSNIVRRDLEEVEAGLQATGSTSVTAKKIAAFTNLFPMPDSVGKGLGLQSPMKIENLIRGHLGGMSRIGLDITDTIIAGIDGAPPEPAEPVVNSLWVVRRFFRRYPSTQSQPVERFYRQYTDSMEARKSFEELISRGDQLGVEKLKLRRGFDLRMHDPAKGIGSALAQIRGRMDVIRRDEELSAKAKSAQLDELTLRIVDIARNAHEAFERLREEEANVEPGKIKFEPALGVDEGEEFGAPMPTAKPRKPRPIDVSQAMRRGEISAADIPKIARERRAAD